MDRFSLRFLSLICLSTITLNSYAANIEYLWDKTQAVSKLKLFNVVNKTKEIVPGKAQLFNNKARAGNYEYRLRNAFIDADGVTHSRYDEFYKNLPVLWADTIVHRKNQQSINGTMVTGIEKDVTNINPKLTQDQGIAIAIKHFGKPDAKLVKSQLVIFPKDTKAYLAYHISYFTKDANPVYVIDANDGSILKYYDNRQRAQEQVGTGNGGNTNPALTNGVYYYGGAGVPTLGAILVNTETPAGSCTWSNRGIAAVNMSNATNNPSIFPILTNNEFNYPAAVIPGCTSPGYVNANDNGQAPVNGGRSPDNDILYFGTQTYNLFATYSVRSPSAPFGNGNPAVRLYVNLDSTDAFAQNAGCGNEPDACYNQQAAFGNGQSQFYPQVGYDVVGHEIAHIYVGRTSGLVYSDQSGGMNESFADMTGAALGAYIHSAFSWFPPISNTPPLNNPLGISVWTQGALDSRTSPALRYLYNPPLDGNSISNAANYTRGMAVHFSSGVYNKAFYNFAVSISNGDIFNAAAILQAYRFVVAANDTYWTANIDWNHAACGVILTAQNSRYGGNHTYSRLATNAFAAVGVHCMRGLNKIAVT